MSDTARSQHGATGGVTHAEHREQPDARSPRDQVLEAVGAGRDDAAVRHTFAQVALRRLSHRDLAEGDPASSAARLDEAFDALDARDAGDPDAITVRVDVRPSGIDGRERTTTVVQIVTEDRPLLLSTVVATLTDAGYPPSRTLHPIVGTERSPTGRLRAITGARDAAHRDSLLHLELPDLALDPDEAEALTARLRQAVGDVVVATDDHEAMRSRLAALADDLRAGAWPGTEADDPAEVAALIEWLLDDHLVLLGIREYTIDHAAPGGASIQVRPGRGLGLLADEDRSRFHEPVPVAELPERLQVRVADPPLLTVARTRRRSTVQRRAPMEALSFTRRDRDGRAESELRLVGLFTRKAEAEPSRTTPVLRTRLREVLAREDVVPGSHDEITFDALFQAVPTDELLRTDAATLHTTLVTLLRAEQRGDIGAAVHADGPAATISVLVTVPRDRYEPKLTSRVQRVLTDRFGARAVTADVALGDRPGALLRVLLEVDEPIDPPDPAELEDELRAALASWDDELASALRATSHTPGRAGTLGSFAARLPATYRDTVPPELAVADLALLTEVAADEDTDLAVALRAGPDGRPRLIAARRGPAIELSGFLPILENLGLVVVEERPHRLADEPGMVGPGGDEPGMVGPGGDEPGMVGPGRDELGMVGPGREAELHLHDLGFRRAPGVGSGELDLQVDGPRLAAAVRAAWRGHLEVDSLNRLVLAAGLTWPEVTWLRAYRRYRRQLGVAYTPRYVDDALVANPAVVRALVDHVRTRFDPALAADDVARNTAREVVVEALDALDRLDHDRILRGLLELVDATVRTNFYRPDAVTDDTGEPYLALKFDPSTIDDVHAPVPYREVFVHAPSVEGVHLRAGPVARGGLRWSDRHDDVRAEVRELVDAQVRKNAVIVPTGAKGGFVVRDEPDEPSAVRAAVERGYITFVRGLLDLTDDLDGDEVVAPDRVVRHDDDDPYLVVAADRGTATLSDTANALAQRYGYWLDDAFASGGSHGYDHKALGVTARGAWICVERHFREVGVHVATDPVTVAGVGDMSGDVFGNGLLRSRAVRLVAAFDHRHVFLDPDPDPEASFTERQRLFDLPRSSWKDYDPARLSPGGMVIARTARRVELTDQVRSLLRIEATTVTPPELVRAVLTAPVDLLFAGGIGTYIKASTEPDTDLGDRANAEVRVDADKVRARVLGEGANLFATQRARIELARRGVRCNQDAVDNAAGVATSDQEVNLKILLQLAAVAPSSGRDQTASSSGRDQDDLAERDAMLDDLADDVVAHVLAIVDRQAAGISQEVARSATSLASHRALLRRLEAVHELDRGIELLPDDAELEVRAEAGGGLARPELATLVAWAKRDLTDTLLDSEVPDLSLTTSALTAGFPGRVVARFGELLPRHRLRRELTATGLANEIVDRLGGGFVAALGEDTGASVPEVVVATWIAREVLDAPRWWAALTAMDMHHDPARLLDLEDQFDGLVAEVTAALLADGPIADPSARRDRDRAVARELLAAATTLGGVDRQRVRAAHARWLIDDLVDPELARVLACSADLAVVPDVADVLAETSTSTGHASASATGVAAAFWHLEETLGLDRLARRLERLAPARGWARRDHRGQLDDLRRIRRDGVALALAASPEREPVEAVTRRLRTRVSEVNRTRAIIAELESSDAGRDGIAVALRAAGTAVSAPRAG